LQFIFFAGLRRNFALFFSVQCGKIKKKIFDQKTKEM